MRPSIPASKGRWPGMRVAGQPTATTRARAAGIGLRAMTSIPTSAVKPKIASRTSECISWKSMRSNGSWVS